MAVSKKVEDYSDDVTWSAKESEDDENEERNEGNSGWADAMAKILNKDLPDDKPVILTKYKKGNKRKAEQKQGIKQKKKKADERHTMFENNHVIPDSSTFPHDKDLMRIATRGVVKLFNAVNKHQKDVETKLKKATTENKKSKVIESMNKTMFLDMLKGTTDLKTTNQDNGQKDKKAKSHQTESSSWSILQDDFMMGAKMKDWDRVDENPNKTAKQNDDLQDQRGDDITDDDDDDGSLLNEIHK